MRIQNIKEPAREIPVAWEADIGIIGGSCTGVFAAVRAAQLGFSVALIENNVIFGGMATAAMVNDWHSTLDAFHEEPVIGGVTLELIDRLKRRGAVAETQPGPMRRSQFRFNSAEMAGELDCYVRENGVKAFLGARFCAVRREDNTITHAIFEDKSGRRAMGARVWIDASGDADLIRRAGFAAYQHTALQPVNLQALVNGLNVPEGRKFSDLVADHAEEFGYPRDNSTPWLFPYAGAPALVNVFGPRLNGVDASDADALTEALFEGRRHHRTLIDMMRREWNIAPVVVAWPHALGVRETWHARCLHQLQADELLNGVEFPDSIARGTYPVDVHSPEGTVLRYIDGREERVARNGSKNWTRWRSEKEPTPRFYSVPFRSLVPREAQNVLVAGRALDASPEAFGGVRVMVNTNQMGEAAGVAAALSLRHGVPIKDVPIVELQDILNLAAV